MKLYNVTYKGSVIKTFTDPLEARQFLVGFVMMQDLYLKQLDYLDESVLKSDLSEANQVLQHIMEM